MVDEIQGDSQEAIAYRLYLAIARVENKWLPEDASGKEEPDRKWILDTYAECLSAVRGNRKASETPKVSQG